MSYIYYLNNIKNSDKVVKYSRQRVLHKDICFFYSGEAFTQELGTEQVCYAV